MPKLLVISGWSLMLRAKQVVYRCRDKDLNSSMPSIKFSAIPHFLPSCAILILDHTI
jgi:hypothetical protein